MALQVYTSVVRKSRTTQFIAKLLKYIFNGVTRHALHTSTSKLWPFYRILVYLFCIILKYWAPCWFPSKGQSGDFEQIEEFEELLRLMSNCAEYNRFLCHHVWIPK